MKTTPIAFAICALCALPAAWPDAPLLRPFAETGPSKQQPLVTLNSAEQCAQVAAGKGVETAFDAGKRQLKVTFPPRTKLPSVTLWQSAATLDLSMFTHLRVLMHNPGTDRITLWFTVDDAAPDTKGARFGIPVDPGGETAVLPVHEAFCSVSGQRIDPAKLTRLEAAMEAQGSPGVLHIAAVSAVETHAPPRGLRGFDFGNGMVFPGMIGVETSTLYTKERGYGLVSNENLRSQQRRWQFGFSGDGLNGPKLSFAVDVPNGTYGVQVIGYGVDWRSIRNRSYRFDAEGRNAVKVQIDQDNYYTTQHFFFGYDRFFEPTRTVYDQYFKDYFAPNTIETVSVTDGQLNLNCGNMMVCAAWVYPAASRELAGHHIEAMRQEEAYFFAKRGMHVVFDTKPGEAACCPPEWKEKGYALFARDFQYRVYPDYEPAAEEYLKLYNPESEPYAPAIETWAAPGEYEPVTFCVRPLTGLKKITVTVSSLWSQGAPESVSIPPGAVEVAVAKQVPIRAKGVLFRPTPRLLVPAQPISAPAHHNRQFWLTLRVPPQTPAGTYTGRINVEADGVAAALPWTVHVHPFSLEPPGVSLGMWDNLINKHDVAFKWEERDEFVRGLIRNQLEDMIAHGLNGVPLPAPKVTNVRKDGSFDIDWAYPTIMAEEILRTPLKDHEHMISLLNIFNYRFMRSGLKEFSPPFEAALKRLLDSLMEWKERLGIRIFLQVVDEPRETNINDWNRNRKDTVWYLKAIRRMAPELRTTVTLMGDQDIFGDSYLPMVPLMDICWTHSTPKSRQCIFLSREEKLSEYWQYNNGMQRFPYGFFVWRDRALAHWQWAYSWSMADQHVPFFSQLGSDAVAAAPGGTVRPTLRYEAVREGIDDLRYLRTLEKALREAKEGDAAAKQARRFLKALELFLPKYPKHLEGQSGESAGTKYTEDAAKVWYGLWRRQIAEYIIAIRQAKEPVKLAEAWAMFPAGITRDKKTAECVILRKGEEPPVVDGDFNDAAWKDVPVQSYFMNFARNAPAETQTEVKIVTDGEKVTFAFRCVEPKISQLVADHMERDQGQWQDDSVEMFMDTNLDRKTYYQAIVNCQGAVQDHDHGGMGAVWDAALKVATKKVRGEWRAEIAIDLASLNVKSVEPGQKWGLNLCRNRKPPLTETSSWTYVGHSFHTPSGFGTLVFVARE